MQTNNTRQIQQISCLMNFQKTQVFYTINENNIRIAPFTLKAIVERGPKTERFSKNGTSWRRDSGFK